MQKRDRIVLIVAITCGLLAMLLTVNFLSKNKARQKTYAIKANGTKSLPIPQGMGAFSISAKEIQKIPDQLQVGSYVDILGMAPNYTGKLDLQTIIRSAQVISAEKKENEGIQSLTLALSPAGSEVLSKATAEDKVRLILRPDAGSKSVFQLDEVSVTEVIRGVRKEKNVRI